MMSQEELYPWSDPDTRFFADNLLGVEDWGESIGDIKFDPNEVLLGDKDVEMMGNDDDLSDLLTNLGEDMWSISEETLKSLGSQIKQEPPSPSSSVSSYISMDSPLPSSPESQLLLNGQSSPPHQSSSIQDVKPLYFMPNPIKTESVNTSTAPSCSTTKPTNSCIKTEASMTPSSCIKKEQPIQIQPVSLVKPVQTGIVIQNGAPVQAKIIQTGNTGIVTTNSIKYIPVNGGIATTAIIVNKPGQATLTVPKPMTTAVANCVAARPQQKVLDVNDKMFRRQQRMIKNRESACQSRKKKKEYLDTLQAQIKDVNKLNEKLTEENNRLKKRVQELENENNILKNRNPELVATVKKSTCVLAIVLLVALNVGPFGSLKDQWKFGNPDVPMLRHGRALLQYKGEDTIDAQPLVYYRPVAKPLPKQSPDSLNVSPKRTEATFTRNTEIKDLIVVKKKWDLLAEVNRKRALLKKKERKLRNIRKRMNNRQKSNTTESMVCPSPEVNATETTRLNEAMKSWVQRYEIQRILKQKKHKAQQEKIKSTVKNIALGLTSNCTAAEARKRINRHMFSRRHNAASTSTSTTDNAVQIFQGPDPYKLFSEAINRQDDILYIVSFRRDHLLFPATRTNSTHRPKMSLMMMAPPNETALNGTTNDQDFISMMQIDCEILDTKHIQVKKSSLPIPPSDSSYRPASQPFNSKTVQPAAHSFTTKT